MESKEDLIIMLQSELKELGKTFQLTRLLGSGGFAYIFQGINIKTNFEVAIKLEPVKIKRPQLIFEAKLYQHFSLVDSSVFDKGIPNVYYSGTEWGFNILVMDLLGPSLEELFQMCNRRFTLKTVLMLADQMLTRIEYVHNMTFLHKDIKPHNFLIGRGENSHKIYIIDFGLAKRFIQNNGEHIYYRDDKYFAGTARFASLKAHAGIEQARRDDLESLGYVLLYFLRGSLPWQNIEVKNKRDEDEKILKTKFKTTVECLCEGFPSEFATYITYCKNLWFDEEPDYAYLKNLFKDLFQKSGFEYDYMYDWVLIGQDIKKDKEKQEISDALDKLIEINTANKMSNSVAVNTSQVKKEENNEENKNSQNDNGS